jgi:membrane dipeptidase
MLIDLHADTPLWMHRLGYRFCRKHKPWLPMGAWLSNVDLPRMHQVNMDAQMFGLVTLPTDSNPLATAQAMIKAVQNETRNSLLRIVRNANELRAAREQNARACLLSLEGVHALKGDLAAADVLISQGVISFGLAHFHANEACTPARAIRGKGDAQAGLTKFGHELVSYLGQRGAIVDLTHVNRRGFFDAIQAATGRVLVSHTGVSGAYNHWRNIDDAQIRAIADKGGVVGIMFSRHFLGGSDIDAVVKHIEHVVNVGGEACAALGSDFDGFIVPVRGLRDITGLPALAEALRSAGLSARVVDGIMGNNALSVF